MRRALPHSAPLLAALLLCCSASGDTLSDAVSALQRGDFAGAETILRTRLKSQPNDGPTLSLLAAALDNEKNYSEADAVYRRAIALAPHSASLLNNYGNHLLASGDSAGARSAFLRVIAVDPVHANANIQLARIALERSAAADALHYLERIPASEQTAPEVALLRMRALYVSDRVVEADAIAAELARAAESDVRLGFSTGLELAAAKQYGKAEMFFSPRSRINAGQF